jgi:hypothetical protein
MQAVQCLSKRLMKNPSIGLNDAVLAVMKAYEHLGGVHQPGEHARSKMIFQQTL